MLKELRNALICKKDLCSSIFVALFSRLSGVVIQYIFIFLIFHYYSAAIAGEVSVLQSVASMVVMASSMAMPRLVAVRFNSYSDDFYRSAFFFSAVIAIFLSMGVCFFVSDFSFGVGLVFMLIVLKIADAGFELSSVFYRKNRMDVKLLKNQILRILVFSLFAYLIFAGWGFFYVILFLFGGWVVLFLFDFSSFGCSRFFSLVVGAWPAYRILLVGAYMNIFSALLSTSGTVMPRLIIADKLGHEAAGYFSLYFYVFVGVVTISSLVIQMLVVRDEDFLKNFPRLLRNYSLYTVIFCSLSFIASVFLVGMVFPEVVHSNFILMMLIVAAFFSGFKELYSYRLIKNGHFLRASLPSFISLLFLAASIFFVDGGDGILTVSVFIALANAMAFLVTFLMISSER